MTARSRPEDIEYISRLKFGSQFSYTPDHHTKEDIDVDNYFHNVSRHAQNEPDTVVEGVYALLHGAR